MSDDDPSGDQPILINGLTKRYDGSVTAVDALNLTISRGEVMGFLGPNGAGKTTTINVLLDLVRPTAGTVEIFGMDPRQSARAIRERVGILPESYQVRSQLTGREYIEWAIEEKAATDHPDDVLSLVNLDSDGDRSAGTFSKGMKQRLMLGMALVGDPDLLILDEPSTGLDPTGLRRVRSIITERADEGTAVFFSTHILSEVEAVCDRVAILDDGRLVAENSLDELRRRAGERATIEVVCASPPPLDRVRAIDGVSTVERRGDRVVTHCDDPGVKHDVVAAIGRETSIRDIVSEPSTLEDVFERYVDVDRGADSSRTGTTDDSETEARPT